MVIKILKYVLTGLLIAIALVLYGMIMYEWYREMHPIVSDDEIVTKYTDCFSMGQIPVQSTNLSIKCIDIKFNKPE